ncbi:signal peptidase I [Halarchaeum nitratireducens]|uniref:S26 family signal peptidase n=1 Tax=Halarchaeum nitratireducens TaxID=489913 RepID=A0A830G9A7_9EURY|nr:signal peptidase I [Halarchaeum nitratireducens]MBP2249811.1 signal peptidase [Halarchaeum solikamskense]GGN10418.1 S26 family signal peptidase [Halarchaeum nitratireducens]
MLRTVSLAAFLVVAALVAAPAGSPVQVSYVYSDSMSPTLGIGDGYVLVPAGDVDSGDVVTFWSETRGAYTTHRVVAETADGFRTKGDNNPVADQAAGYPPVPRDAVIGRVLTWNDAPVVIPHLGRAVRFVHEHVALLAGLVGLAALLGRGRATGRPSRPASARSVLVPLLFAAVVGTAGVVALGGVTHAETVLAVENPTGTGSIPTVATGSSHALNYTVAVPSRPWTDRVVHTAGLRDVAVSRNATALTVSGRIRAPTDPGAVPVEVAVRRYPAVLPHSLLARLDAIEPLLAAALSAALAFSPAIALAALIDGRERLRGSRSRWWRLLTEGFE